MTDIDTGTSKMQLVDWLDDLCARFIINLPHEELLSVERICFQIEEAQWFYEDFLRPLDPSLPSMNLRRFALLMFQHCPLSAAYPQSLHEQAYDNFLAYKTRVPVRGAIMLNSDMTHAVLVKGWKKGAKWSFPRGKINKEEADLDCAVREVYEETGYELKEAGLVGPEDQMKKIVVSMREQEMMLYVFRGVPMDTYFEPRTRKEISKIDWYKLTDLPTLKRNKHAQQGNAQEGIKDNHFYMVAPFLGPLKAWIKQQHRLDKQKAKSGPGAQHLAPPVPAAATDTELEGDLGETTADEAAVPEDNLAGLLAKLGGRGHRASDALPEVSDQVGEQVTVDPAAELKRLLSVGAGSGLLVQSPPVEAPTQSNPLLAMLHGNSNPVAQQQPPMTPFDQFITPIHPQSPHGQRHPRQPHLDQMAPPPPYPLNSHQSAPPFRGPQHVHMPHQPHRESQAPQVPFRGQFVAPPPSLPDNPPYPVGNPNVQQLFGQQPPRPYQQTGDPQFAHASQSSNHQGPRIPQATDLPAPKLTAHALGLLNSFKSQEKPHPPPHLPPSIVHEAPQTQHQPPVLHHQDSISSPPHILSHPYAPSPPPFQSSPPSSTFQPVQPKPRSAHQDSLLNLFRSPSLTAATPEPPKTDEALVELSAMPTTPGHPALPAEPQHKGPPAPISAHQANLLAAFGQKPNHPGVTTATVSGPVNVPDFETMKRNTHLNDANGHGQSRGPSPNQRKSAEQRQFIPQQILKRNDTVVSRESPSELGPPSKHASPSTSNVSTPQATTFKPHILRRPQPSTSPAPPSNPNSNPLLALLGQHASPQPAPAQLAKTPPVPAGQLVNDRRNVLPTDQKSALLSLFGQPPRVTASPKPISTIPVPPFGVSNPPSSITSLSANSPLPGSPGPAGKSAQPPTPKNLMSGVISPVSPLPGQGSQMNSPANAASRSRISSIGEPGPTNIVVPPAQSNNHLIEEGGLTSSGPPGLSDRLGAINLDKGKVRATSPSATDKSFLLGFLENVAKGSGR